MHIPEGFILALFVIMLFTLFAIFKIKEGKEESKNSGKLNRAIGKLGVVSARIILLWALFSMVIIVAAILIYLSNN